MLLDVLFPGLLCGLVLAGLAGFGLGWGVLPSLMVLVVTANITALVLSFMRGRGQGR